MTDAECLLHPLRILDRIEEVRDRKIIVWRCNTCGRETREVLDDD